MFRSIAAIFCFKDMDFKKDERICGCKIKDFTFKQLNLFAYNCYLPKITIKLFISVMFAPIKKLKQ
ncbi:MAG: hypothetical protein CL526_12240 [Aequorivita sp.]|nr:hypothetical protein [Aequorivita sp.]